MNLPHPKLTDQAVGNMLRNRQFAKTIRDKNKAVVEVMNEQKELSERAEVARIKAERQKRDEDAKLNEQAIDTLAVDQEALKSEKEERRLLLQGQLEQFELDIVNHEMEVEKIGLLCGVK